MWSFLFLRPPVQIALVAAAISAAIGARCTMAAFFDRDTKHAFVRTSAALPAAARCLSFHLWFVFRSQSEKQTIKRRKVPL